MAAHNQVRVLGYLLSDPAIYEDETGDANDLSCYSCM